MERLQERCLAIGQELLILAPELQSSMEYEGVESKVYGLGARFSIANKPIFDAYPDPYEHEGILVNRKVTNLHEPYEVRNYDASKPYSMGPYFILYPNGGHFYAKARKYSDRLLPAQYLAASRIKAHLHLFYPELLRQLQAEPAELAGESAEGA